MMKNRKLVRGCRRWRNMAAKLWRNRRRNRPLHSKRVSSDSSTQPQRQTCSDVERSDSKNQRRSWRRASSTCKVRSSAIMISTASHNLNGIEDWKQNFLTKWEAGYSLPSIQSWLPSRSTSGTRSTSSYARRKTSRGLLICSLSGGAAPYRSNPGEMSLSEECGL